MIRKSVVAMLAGVTLAAPALAQPPGAVLYSIYDANAKFVGTAYGGDQLIHEFNGVPYLIEANQAMGIVRNEYYVYATPNCTGQPWVPLYQDFNLFPIAYFDGTNFIVPDTDTVIPGVVVNSSSRGGTCNWLSSSGKSYVQNLVELPKIIKPGNPWVAPLTAVRQDPNVLATTQ